MLRLISFQTESKMCLNLDLEDGRGQGSLRTSAMEVSDSLVLPSNPNLERTKLALLC